MKYLHMKEWSSNAESCIHSALTAHIPSVQRNLIIVNAVLVIEEAGEAIEQKWIAIAREVADRQSASLQELGQKYNGLVDRNNSLLDDTRDYQEKDSALHQSMLAYLQAAQIPQAPRFVVFPVLPARAPEIHRVAQKSYDTTYFNCQ